METDGKEYLAKYLDKKSFFRFSCRRLDITDEKTAVDEDGLYLKHQIREWMKYWEVAKAGESLKELLESARDARTANSLAKSDMGEAESAIRESENDNGQSGQNGGEPDAGGQSGSAADGAGGRMTVRQQVSPATKITGVPRITTRNRPEERREYNGRI